MSETAALELSAVTAGYGETMVLDDLSLNLAPGESISVIGRNGVGKTTLLATVMGHTTLHGGEIRMQGADISATQSFRRVNMGLGYVPQEREIFPSLSVDENLNVGARPGAWTREALFQLFPNLAERRTNMGNQLSGGELQMLAIARALMTNPRVLLMDEPSEGLAPVIVEELVRVMARLRDEAGMSIILVEQNTRIALEFSTRTVVMDRGRITYDGDSEALRADAARLESLIGISG
ncbi:MAG: ABC transporter ATP-binding protein [Rhodospirillales bacterium]|jgi:branched-chain amino acid transport system ATP-binding protein|nr:ABC transporter ATP-binding protein [Rhodospirillales bacterium]MDP6646753.1 ABC transporter ATP-binding protein [Rhodospirillales bacterium]MDP6843511.1 ABC transporter ATP-binding protein [Rhodospirillales bacterium]|tara:strand:+ start:290 stop:1000 length:711 start_codon:yes stop_codon:yes gene_type:complete